MRTLRTAVAVSCALVVSSLPLHAATTEGARHKLIEAARRTLDEESLHSERHFEPDNGQVLIEDFIRPDRVRALIPQSDLDGAADSGESKPPTLLIAIGETVYVQDSNADPPKDQLFVACEVTQNNVSEFVWMLALTKQPVRVHQIADGTRYRYRFPDEKELGPLASARVVASLSGGRIVELALTGRSDGAKTLVYSLTFGAVAPIDPPTPDQIANDDCEFSQLELVDPLPTISLVPRTNP